jgi:ComF family protein
VYTSCFGGVVFSSSRLIKAASLDFASVLVRNLPASVFSLIFPDECRLCAQPLNRVSRVPVCPACLAKPSALSAEYFCVQCRSPFLTRFPLDEEGRCGLCRRGVRGFDAAYSFGFYEDALRELIHLFKYGRVQTLASPLGRLLARALPLEQTFDVIVPMPLHWRKRWRRGFNQSELLAREIGRRTQLPVKKALRRVRHTNAQAGLTNAKRRENVSGAFRARKFSVLDGQRVLLVDDVMTTGATAASGARALKLAGAKHVTLLTLARVDRRFGFDLPIRDLNFSGSAEDAQPRSIA